MPQLITTRKSLQDAQASYQGKAVAFVPTMGALHAGHLALVEEAKKLADIVWVSIFVNPLQFGPNEDFNKYPRTLENDIKLLETLGVDYVWAPSVDEMYGATEPITIQANPELANKLCGLSRPGHFDGVCTVVNLLFYLIKPDYAVFGEKDFQQLTIITEMVERLKLPVKIIPVATLRETNGLALSSRNKYLSAAEKELASNIYKTISSLKAVTENDLTQAKNKLESLGIKVEYLESHWNRILVAARVGTTRLIDNIARCLSRCVKVDDKQDKLEHSFE